MEENIQKQLNQEQTQPQEPKKGYDKRTWVIVVLVAVLIVGGLVLSQIREAEVVVMNFEASSLRALILVVSRSAVAITAFIESMVRLRSPPVELWPLE